MEKILINTCIFENPLYNRILFILGSAKLGLVMICKSFPFGFSWSPHNNWLSATWPFGTSTLCSSTKGLSMLSHFCLGHQVHLSRSVTFNFLPLQLPPYPMGSCSLGGRTHRVTVWFGLLRDIHSLDRLAWNHKCWRTGCAHSDRNAPSSSCSPYINKLSSSHFFTFSKTPRSKRTCHPCQTITLFRYCIRHHRTLHIPSW